MTTATSGAIGANPWAKALAAIGGTAALLTIMVLAFALPASRSAPHGVPIGVVGTPKQRPSAPARTS